jgi:predicted dienelactone hydrolase
VVAIVPGFVSYWSQIAWLGPRLASQGFVVIGIDTTSPLDQPQQRAAEFAAALNNEKTDPALNGIADFGRTSIAGWSMGGGGALDAAKAYVELAGAGHSFTTTANVPQAASMISWLKRYVDGDTRYRQFLAPGPPVATGFSAYQTNSV